MRDRALTAVILGSFHKNTAVEEEKMFILLAKMIIMEMIFSRPPVIIILLYCVQFNIKRICCIVSPVMTVLRGRRGD